MNICKRIITTSSIVMLIAQSILPISLFAADPYGNSESERFNFDTRVATINIGEEYNGLLASGGLGTRGAIEFAAKLYAVMVVGPLCEQQASTVYGSFILGGKAEEGETADTAQTKKISPVCMEIFDNQNKDPSADLLKIYEKFFTAFFPGLDFNAIMEETSQASDQDAYFENILTADQVQSIYDYLDNKKIPDLQSCTLTATDEQSYKQTKAEYIAATENGYAEKAKIAFNKMNQIQSRTVCPPGVAQAATINPVCTNKIATLKSQIVTLQTDPALYQQDIARIQRTMDTMIQSPDCSFTTKRTQFPAFSSQGSAQRLTTDVLQFQAAAPTNIPDTTPPFCKTTASALVEQLETASYPTVNRLIDTIKNIKSDLTPQKKLLATLVETLAVEKATVKAQRLGLNNPSDATHRFVNMLEMVANNILTNTSLYKVVDVFPFMEQYSDAIDQTSLGMADTFDSMQKILDAGVKFIWNDMNQSFDEEKTSNPGLTFLARANEESQENNLSVAVKELSAFQFREWIEEFPYSSLMTATAPSIQDLSVLYFGSQDGQSNPYENIQNNRVWYDISPSKETTISDTNYRLLVANKKYYNYLPMGHLPIEMFDVNGMHIAIVADHKNRVVKYLNPGVYINGWVRIEVGENGQATILHENENTYPRAIDLSASVDGALSFAIVGDITWPEELAPFVERIAQKETNNIDLSSADQTTALETTIASRSKEREDMLPERITGEIFFDPNVLQFELDRTYDSTNGTNTITLNATLVGGATCGVQINGSVTYVGNEYGMFDDGDNEADISSVMFDIGTEAYTLNIASSDIGDIVEQIQNFMEGEDDDYSKGNEDSDVDLPALINEKVSNSLSTLGTPFGSLFLTEDGLSIRYLDQKEEDFMDIVMPVIENMDLGWLGDLMDFADDEWDDESGKVDPGQQQAHINDYSQDQNLFTISFIGDDASFVNLTGEPVLYVDVCTDVCSSYNYSMDRISDGYYGYTIPSEIYEQAASIYVEASYNGYQIYHQFM